MFLNGKHNNFHRTLIARTRKRNPTCALCANFQSRKLQTNKTEIKETRPDHIRLHRNLAIEIEIEDRKRVEEKIDSKK